MTDTSIKDFEAAIAELGKHSNVRAEELAPLEFLELAKALG